MIPARSTSVAAGAVMPLLALAGVLVILSFVIVTMPGPVPILLVVGSAAVVVLTVYRSTAVYALALLSPFGLSYRVMGLEGIGPVDAVLLMALVVCTISLLEGGGKVNRFGLPLGRVLLGFWLLMLMWGSLTFLLGPVNQAILKDPLRDTWYLYRGVWRDFLVFPVVVLCLADWGAAKKALALTVIASSLVSVYAILLSWQTHEPAMGPFSSKNGLAGFLVLILPFVVARVLLEKRLQSRLLYGCAAFIMFRALWLTASRGGFVAFLVSLAPFCLLVPVRRLMAAGMAILVVLLIVVGMRGNILERPNLQRYLTVGSFSEQHNFQWREAQWRIFMARIAERPWLGSGSEVVEDLNKEGRLPTAHNGYLGMTLKAGIPATAAWIAILLLVEGLSLRFGLKAKGVEERVFWIGTAGLVLAWLTHSLVDNVLLMSEAQRVFWLVVGMALIQVCTKRNGSVASVAQAGASR